MRTWTLTLIHTVREIFYDSVFSSQQLHSLGLVTRQEEVPNKPNDRRGPDQDVPFDLILWYTAKTNPTFLK